ncbi:hypothetical protein ACTGU9_00345 [Streptococcus suis]|uniref:hypothetical protein n=1 Tax=Streptococcus suis TaxID=1307 RepID=UPI0038B8E15E
MSTEQQDRQAAQYLERSAIFTVRNLYRLLAFTAQHLTGEHSAYKIGRQELETLLNSPYQISTIRLDETLSGLSDKEVDFEKFNQLMEERNFPLAYTWVNNTLYFYTKDKSVLDDHLTQLLEELADNPEMFKDMTKDKTLNEEISKAKGDVVFEKGAVKDRELVR